MGNLTSTLSIKLLDDVSGPAGKAAGALKGLASSGGALKGLAAASPEVAKLTKQLNDLSAASGKIAAFRGASKGLDAAGAAFRAARQDVARYTADLAKAQARAAAFKGVKGASAERTAADAEVRRLTRALRDANAAATSTKAAFVEQGQAVRAMRADLTAAGVPLKSLKATEDGLKASIAGVNAELARQPALMAAAASKAAGLARANSAALKATVEAGLSSRADRARREREVSAARAGASASLVAGMGASGRRQHADILGGRRLAEGMGSSSRVDRAARAQAEAEAAEKAEQRSAESATAKRALLGLGGLYVSHKVKEGTHATLETYREFDKERRFGKAVMGLTDEEQAPLVDQAVHMGATTRYNDVQVLEAQRELAARGLKKDQVMGLMEPAANLGQSLDLNLPDAVKQMEGAIFGFKKDISTLDAAKASAKQTADVQVKAAKISGMTPEDISQTYKYGATPARMAGVSEETLLAFGGISKKANMGGDEAGVAFRALIANAQSPTRKAKEAMLANGMDFKNYQKNPDRLDTAAFKKQVAASYGVKLDKGTTEGIDKIFNDKALISSPEKFTPAVMKLLSANLGGDDAKSKRSIAGLANRFRDASMNGVDTNALIGDLMKKLPDNLQLANAIFGSKQGARIATALGDPEVFKHMIEELLNHRDGFAEQISKQRSAGYDGAMKRFEGATKNLETAMGRSWDNGGKGGVLTALTDAAGKATQALAELPRPALMVASGLAWITGKAAGAAGTLALVGAAISLKGSAAALTAAAGRLALGGAAGAAAAAAGPAAGAAAGVAGGAVAGTILGPAAVAAAVASGGVIASIVATDAVKNSDFAQPYLDNPMLGADPAGYGLGAAIVHADTLPETAEMRGREARRQDIARRVAAVPGIRASAAPTETGSGRTGFGLHGPIGASTAVPTGAGASEAAVPGFGRSPLDPTAIQAATTALSGYKAELASVEAQLAGIKASGEAAFSPETSGLEARKAEIETAISGLSDKLKALGATPIAPQVDRTGIDGLGTAADVTHGKLSAIDGVTVSPKGDTSGLQALEGILDRIAGKLAQLGSSIAGVKAQAASVSVPSGPAGGGRQASSGVVRRELSNNFT